jgi:hypothetical protein
MTETSLSGVYEELKERRRRGGSKGEAGQLPIRFFLSHRRANNPEINRVFERFKWLDVAGGDDSDEYLVRVIDIKVLADRIFGDEGKAEAWLERPNSGLSGQRPVELLKDELGAAVVREMLERIDHGIFA